MTERPRGRDDLDTLLNSLLPFAKQQLGKRGEFYPFGNVMQVTGEVQLLAGYADTEHPPSQEVIDLLIEGMQQQAVAGEIRAAGLCFDSRIRLEDGSPTDAITVDLEHFGGDAVRAFVPYSKGRFTGYRFGDLIASPGAHRVFLATSGDITGH